MLLVFLCQISLLLYVSVMNIFYAFCNLPFKWNNVHTQNCVDSAMQIQNWIGIACCLHSQFDSSRVVSDNISTIFCQLCSSRRLLPFSKVPNSFIAVSVKALLAYSWCISQMIWVMSVGFSEMDVDNDEKYNNTEMPQMTSGELETMLKKNSCTPYLLVYVKEAFGATSQHQLQAMRVDFSEWIVFQLKVKSLSVHFVV